MDKECGHPPHPSDDYDPSLGCYDCFMEELERETDLIEGEYDHGIYDYVYVYEDD